MIVDISVITPVYNCEKYISECIESVRCQNGIEVEHIIVDDGSTDSTRELVSECSDIRYIYQENSGANAARNRGLSIARGNYIKFLDADDFLVEGCLLKQFISSESNPPGSICFGYHEAIFEGKARKGVMRPKLSRVDRLEQLILENIQTSESLYPKAALLAVLGFNERLHARQEWDLNLRLVAAGYAFVPDEIPVLKHRHHDAPQRISNRKLETVTELAELGSIYQSLPEPKSDSFNAAWAAYLWMQGRRHIQQNDIQGAKEFFTRAKETSKENFYRYFGLKYNIARILFGEIYPDKIYFFLRSKTD